MVQGTNVHIFKDYNFARMLWWSYSLALQIQKFKGCSFLELFDEVSSSFEEEGLEIFVVLS